MKTRPESVIDRLSMDVAESRAFAGKPPLKHNDLRLMAKHMALGLRLARTRDPFRDEPTTIRT